MTCGTLSLKKGDKTGNYRLVSIIEKMFEATIKIIINQTVILINEVQERKIMFD